MLFRSNPLNGSWGIIPFYLSLRLELTIHQLPLGGWIRLRNPTNGSWWMDSSFAQSHQRKLVDGFKRAIPSTEVGWMDSSAKSHQRQLVDGFKLCAIPPTAVGGWIQALRNPTNGSWWTDSSAKSHQRKLVDGFKLCAIPPTEVGGWIQARPT